MNKYGYRYCAPSPKRRPKRKCNNKKLGIIMVSLGIITVLALVLPMKYWVLLLSGSLIVFGFLLLKGNSGSHNK